MQFSLWVTAACACFLGGLADASRVLATPPARPRSRSLGLVVKRKWNWKEASEETKTEWGIVLKRYVMVDLMLFELERKFEEAMPAPGGADGHLVVDEDALEATRKRLAKVKMNLDKAVLDQNTSDATSADMQKVRKNDHLSAAEKKALWKEHLSERYGFFAVEASAQDVLQQAGALQQALETTHNATAQILSWSSIVNNTKAPPVPPLAPASTTVANGTAASPPRGLLAKKKNATSIAEFFQMYQAAAQTFHTDIGNFETMQRKAFTNLLAVPNAGS